MNDTVIMEWLMDNSIQENACVSLAKMTVAAKATSPLHSHPNCTETIHVIKGEVAQRVGDNWNKMTAGETCLIPKNMKHQTKNLGRQAAVMMVAYSEGTRIYQEIEDD